MTTYSTTILQHDLLWILVALGANLHRFVALTSKYYAWEKEMNMGKITAGVAHLLFCNGSGEASGPACQPMRFNQLWAIA